MQKLAHSDIGYYKKPIDSLSREELLDALLELAQRLQECAIQDNAGRSIISIKG